MSDHMEHSLDQELLDLESQLASLVPSAMPGELVARVESAIDHSLIDAAVEMNDAELGDLETHLGQLAPAGLSGDVLSRMVRAMDRWHEFVPVEEKVVPFGASKQPSADQEQTKQKSANYSMYAAAAAVALLGAVAALVMPQLNQTNTVAIAGENTQPSQDVSSSDDLGNIHAVDVKNAPRDAWLVPDSLSHKVTNTRDTGILMTRDNVPHRSIRIDYTDQIKVLDEDGREIEITRPGVQYVLIPVQTN